MHFTQHVKSKITRRTRPHAARSPGSLLLAQISVWPGATRVRCPSHPGRVGSGSGRLCCRCCARRCPRLTRRVAPVLLSGRFTIGRIRSWRGSCRAGCGRSSAFASGGRAHRRALVRVAQIRAALPPRRRDGVELAAHVADYTDEYNQVRPHESLAWRRSLEAHLEPSPSPKLSKKLDTGHWRTESKSERYCIPVAQESGIRIRLMVRTYSPYLWMPVAEIPT